jgi:hypothetical protein
VYLLVYSFVCSGITVKLINCTSVFCFNCWAPEVLLCMKYDISYIVMTVRGTGQPLRPKDGPE